jgi:hypothetical protein
MKTLLILWILLLGAPSVVLADNATLIPRPKILGHKEKTITSYKNSRQATRSCSGSCDNGPTVYWTCPDTQNCQLDCTSGSPVGSCY